MAIKTSYLVLNSFSAVEFGLGSLCFLVTVSQLVSYISLFLEISDLAPMSVCFPAHWRMRWYEVLCDRMDGLVHIGHPSLMRKIIKMAHRWPLIQFLCLGCCTLSISVRGCLRGPRALWLYRLTYCALGFGAFGLEAIVLRDINDRARRGNCSTSLESLTLF